MPTLTSTQKPSSVKRPVKISRIGDSLIAFDGEHTASCNLHFDASNPKRVLITDFYGAAYPWAALLNHLAQWSDEERMELSGWVEIQNRHIKSYWKRGFTPRAILIRRDPQ